MPTTVPRQTFRFGDFELETAGYELRRLGRRVRLGRQPMDLLILLVQKRRDLVSRSEIVEHLWGKDVFVDVDTGVNTAISRVRQALRDAPDAPTFLETVAGRGYRFIASVEAVAAAPPVGANPTELSRPSRTGIALAVLPFEGLGNDPERAYLAAGLTDETSASLAQIDPTHLSIKGRTQRYKDT
ncbi:MAG: winged helix-turn-helix domain-containing protein, partial [Acidobacteriota bacterium]